MNFLLQHILSESARKYPERTAVVYRNESITYSELDELSDRLAGTLIELGLERGARVGTYMPKQIGSIVSIFAVMKAGGAYVPIASDAPVKRVEFILRNCGIKHLISVSNKLDFLEGLSVIDSPLERIILADTQPFSCSLPVEIINWESVLKSARLQMTKQESIDRDLAYILYTSGSTGDPKGVMISHLNSLTYVNWAQEFFNIQEKDRVASHAPLHFDLSVFDIFATLKAGATVVLVPDGTSSFPIRLVDFIENERISVWNSVPSVLVLLLTHGKMERFKFNNLRLVLFAGEKFPVKYLRQIKSIVPHAEFYNQYGQTEANSSTYYKIQHLPDDDGQIPIGKAAANFEVFAIDENNRVITKPGEFGELYVRSSTVAGGYWGDKERTKLAFVDNPLQENSDEKVYKTGDMVNLDENGNFIFVCRKDSMVKSRGYRIELGEIEAVISSHPGVKQTAVVAVPDEIFGNIIKVFIVPSGPDSLVKSDLKRHLSSTLPKYMIPETIEICPQLPMTSTGKVDRRSLAAQR